MALLRWGSGSDLYLYRGGIGYICCACKINNFISTEMETVDSLTGHLERHEQENHSLGEATSFTWKTIYQDILNEDNW